ncbi:unnamed protein product [Calypogeia fissa]
MSSSGAPCGACKFLRRKCVRGCIFAPYFGAEQGAARFAAVHKIFGASNVGKLLLHIPLGKRCDAVLTISYEAQARLSDPVYGCVATIFALQQQVASLQAELAIVQAQLASRLAVAALQQQQQQQQHHQQHHHAGGSGGGSSPYDQQGMPGPSTISIAAGSSSVDDYSNRVKDEAAAAAAAAYHHGMQHCFVDVPSGHQHQHNQHQHQHNLEHIPSSPPDEMDAAASQLQKARSDSMEHGQPRGGSGGGGGEDGDLQALAHALLCRK